MFATWQVCFDVPYAEEIHGWLAELPWFIWAAAGLTIYGLGYPRAGRVVASLASTPGGRVAAAVLWPVTLALFPALKAIGAVCRTVIAPAIRRLDPLAVPPEVALPAADSTRWVGGRLTTPPGDGKAAGGR